MTMFKHVLTGTAVLGTALALSACGQDTEEAPSGADTAEQEQQHNEADVHFAQMMIPHHEQAVEMSDLAEERAGTEVGELAQEIRDAQGPEIEQMQQMLHEWGAAPEEEGADHGDMDGMLTDEQMEELAAAEGETFDTLFLELMIEHHEGAVDMAQDVLDEGSDPEARELAEEIVQDQEEEIEQMHSMLGHDPSGTDNDTEDEGGGHEDH